MAGDKIFTDDELAILKDVWAHLKHHTAGAGLTILDHFFKRQHWALERFEALRDMYGNIHPDYMKIDLMRFLAVDLMEGIDICE